jgi:uncharacterized membrane protein
LAFVLVLAGITGSVGTAATAPTIGAGGAGLQQEPSTDENRIVIQLVSDGSARWIIQQRFTIEDASDEQAFEQLAAAFVAGEIGSGYVDTFDQGRILANTTTGREMRIQNVSRNARIESTDTGGIGVLERSFVWTNFARAESGVVQVGDSFRTPTDGTWFPAISETETLIIRPPAGYGVSSAPAAPSQGVLRWEGPQEFEPGYLNITYEQFATSGEVTPPGDGTQPTDIWSQIRSLTDQELLVLFTSLIGLGLLAVFSYLFTRPGTRSESDEPPATAGSGPETGSAGEQSTSIGQTATGESGSSKQNSTGTTAPDDTDLLSDEERVERLLKANGGRMRQAKIVDETGWSNAKVSQLLSAMDSADQINKLRIGRENLISLPDEDVTAFEE